MTQHYRDAKVGDRYPHEPVRLCSDGPPCWYALRTVPGREEEAKAWLAIYGVHAIFPTITRTRKHRDGTRTPVERATVPGYVFARLPGLPRWHIIRATGHIIGVVGHDGAPYPLSYDRHILPIKGLAKRAREAETARLEAEERARQIHIGDNVRFRGGPLSDFVVEVASLSGRIAKLRFALLGRDEIEADVADLINVDEPTQD